MELAEVVGKVVATAKEEGMRGYSLLLVVPLTPGLERDGEPFVALDRIGVGPGEIVLIERNKEALLGLPDEFAASDAAVTARVDRVHVRIPEDEGGE